MSFNEIYRMTLAGRFGPKETKLVKEICAEIYAAISTPFQIDKTEMVIKSFADKIAGCSESFIAQFAIQYSPIIPCLVGKVPMRCLTHGARQGSKVSDGVFTARYRDAERLDDLAGRCLYHLVLRAPAGFAYITPERLMETRVPRRDGPVTVWYLL